MTEQTKPGEDAGGGEARLPPDPPRHPICKYLASKKMYTSADPASVTVDELTEGTFQGYWCLHTFTDTGPDDGTVEYARCTPSRSCYVARDGA